MLGSALFNRLKEGGFSNLVAKDSSELNLTNQRAVDSFFKKEKPEYCFLAPIKEGGILLNMMHPAELVYQNIATLSNVVHSAWEAGVKKLLFFASSCVYSKDCPQPMKEEYLLTGPLEPTNEAYAIAKIAGIKMCQAYNAQFGTRFLSVIPATVFGPEDNFDFKTSHVISALIRKFHEGKIKNEPVVNIWGTGKPRREFIYVDDLVDASLFFMQEDNPVELINMGSGMDVSIQELAELIKGLTGFKGKIEFDTTKPDGVLRKLLDSHRLNSLGWRPKVGLQKGLKNTYQWYTNKKVKR